jgi:hypothetical protein
MNPSSVHAALLIVIFGLSRCGAGQSPSSESGPAQPEPEPVPETEPEAEAEPAEAQEPQTQEEEDQDLVIHFKARVLSISMGVGKEGQTITAAVDPRYSMKAKILSIEEEGAPFAKSHMVTFAIHSPAKLFTGGEAKGKVFSFELHGRRAEDGSLSFYHLQLGSDPEKLEN